uniref:Uncharacterized protein n=1 Tax=Acrobeloides nanus TaxID=290746 RepID=A0A914D8B4_9BILA
MIACEKVLAFKGFIVKKANQENEILEVLRSISALNSFHQLTNKQYERLRSKAIGMGYSQEPDIGILEILKERRKRCANATRMRLARRSREEKQTCKKDRADRYREKMKLLNEGKELPKRGAYKPRSQKPK